MVRCGGTIVFSGFTPTEHVEKLIFMCSKCNNITHHHSRTCNQQIYDGPAWRDKTGKFINLPDMEEAHIHRCIKFLKKRKCSKKVKKLWVGLFNKELVSRKPDQITLNL
jgi:hypothetical protein